MTLPPRITYVTLGARDMPGLRAFYRGIGWKEAPDSDDHFAAFDLGTTRLTLYPLSLLGEEAAPGEPAPATGWHGTTWAHSTPSAYRLATQHCPSPTCN